MRKWQKMVIFRPFLLQKQKFANFEPNFWLFFRYYFKELNNLIDKNWSFFQF